MWQRLLDRLVPLSEDLPSRLDRLDGVGADRAPVAGSRIHSSFGSGSRHGTSGSADTTRPRGA
ncbi:hypothetical protein [Pedococcus sp. 5OH_020]|uniref:hypothetical protein n=1 Tax=Pedococcus sp. 5OH_020 TaxID=2989814 RepID=UPI0022E9C15C|nr:hypothetical protein [Pedococcus sp. 5OH_020]